MSYPEIYKAASAYLAAGFSFVPVSADGEKRPAWELLPRVWHAARGKYVVAWRGYMERCPTPDEVFGWFAPVENLGFYGIQIVCGQVSGNLEVVDFDDFDLFAPWALKVQQACTGLLDRLVIVSSPRPGIHVYYRCPSIAGSQKLASRVIANPNTGRPQTKTMIETRGEGGFASPPRHRQRAIPAASATFSWATKTSSTSRPSRP